MTGARIPLARTRNSRSLPAGIRLSAVVPRVPVANVILGQVGAEEDLAAGIRCDHAVAGEAGAEPGRPGPRHCLPSMRRPRR